MPMTAGDWTAAAGRAVDVHPGKGAGVGRAGAVAGHEERGAEVGKGKLWKVPPL